MTIESIVAQINARGYRVNNLFQLHVGGAANLTWQCNITDGKDFTNFSRGETAQVALEKAAALLPKELDPIAPSPSEEPDPFA